MTWMKDGLVNKVIIADCSLHFIARFTEVSSILEIKRPRSTSFLWSKNALCSDFNEFLSYFWEAVTKTVWKESFDKLITFSFKQGKINIYFVTYHQSSLIEVRYINFVPSLALKLIFSEKKKLKKLFVCKLISTNLIYFILFENWNDFEVETIDEKVYSNFTI